MPSAENDAAFYEEHYSDWTVYELPLMVYVPMKDADRGEALALVREILDEAAFDIRVRPIPPGKRCSDFWFRLGHVGDGLPTHLPMGVTRHGQGPTEPDPAHHYECWCGDVDCPLTLALQRAWLAGRRVGSGEYDQETRH